MYRLWELFKDDWVARTAWDAFDVCQSLLADPLSTDADDVARRANVRNRVIAFNAVLAEVCAGYAKCRFDGNAVYNTDFTTSDVSHRDYFHPSLSGQAKLAQTTWNQSFWAG